MCSTHFSVIVSPTFSGKRPKKEERKKQLNQQNSNTQQPQQTSMEIGTVWHQFPQPTNALKQTFRIPNEKFYSLFRRLFLVPLPPSHAHCCLVSPLPFRAVVVYVFFPRVFHAPIHDLGRDIRGHRWHPGNTNRIGILIYLIAGAEMRQPA